MKKIGVVNRTNLKNYGSVLQVYALVEAVKRLGYDAEVVWECGNLSKNFDFRFNKIICIGWKLLTHPKLINITIKTIKEIRQKPIPSNSSIQCFDDFVENNIVTKMYSKKMLTRVAKGDEYYKFICGSDQIWCSTTMYVDPLMYLRFAPSDKRIAYAPSLGRDYIPDYNRHIMKKYISEIAHISVREKKGAKLIESLIGIEVPVVLDPTLLFDRNFWSSVSKPISEENYILCYFLDEPSVEVQRYILDFAKNRLIVALHSNLDFLGNNSHIVYPECGPDQFLSYVEKAEFIFTDSYHGMLFSINYEKQFCAIERNYQTYDQSSRQKSILTLLELNSRYINNITEFDMKFLDYQETNIKLEKMRKASLSFLNNALQDECD